MKKEISLKEILNENQKNSQKSNNQIMTSYHEEIKNKMKTLPECKDLIYGKDFHETDLSTIDNYLKGPKNTLFGYELVLKTKPYIQIVYRETHQSLFHRFQNNLQKMHSLFNQSLDLEQLKTINLQNFPNNHIIKKYWVHYENELKNPVYIYLVILTQGKLFSLN